MFSWTKKKYLDPPSRSDSVILHDTASPPALKLRHWRYKPPERRGCVSTVAMSWNKKPWVTLSMNAAHLTEHIWYVNVINCLHLCSGHNNTCSHCSSQKLPPFLITFLPARALLTACRKLFFFNGVWWLAATDAKYQDFLMETFHKAAQNSKLIDFFLLKTGRKNGYSWRCKVYCPVLNAAVS